MNATRDRALISQAKIGLAFEYGKDNNSTTLKKIVVDIKKIFCYIGLVNITLPESKTATQYFDVVSEVTKPRGYKLLKKIKNYKIVHRGEVFATNGKNRLIAEESFYPILFGEKNYKTIFGFRGKTIF